MRPSFPWGVARISMPGSLNWICAFDAAMFSWTCRFLCVGSLSRNSCFQLGDQSVTGLPGKNPGGEMEQVESAELAFQRASTTVHPLYNAVPTRHCQAMPHYSSTRSLLNKMRFGGAPAPQSVWSRNKPKTSSAHSKKNRSFSRSIFSIALPKTL